MCVKHLKTTTKHREVKKKKDAWRTQIHLLTSMISITIYMLKLPKSCWYSYLSSTPVYSLP